MDIEFDILFEISDLLSIDGDMYVYGSMSGNGRGIGFGYGYGAGAGAGSEVNNYGNI